MKKFIIIGNGNAASYKEIFPCFKKDELWLGMANNRGMYYLVPEDYEYADTYKFEREKDGKKVMRVPSVCWFTNVTNPRRNTPIDLYKRYSNEYKHYDNYDAIEVGKVEEIPMDYDGVMGVPITFLYKYCPKQFEIVGMCASAGYNKEIVGLEFKGEKDARCLIDGKNTYARIFIRKRNEKEDQE